MKGFREGVYRELREQTVKRMLVENRPVSEAGPSMTETLAVIDFGNHRRIAGPWSTGHRDRRGAGSRADRGPLPKPDEREGPDPAVHRPATGITPAMIRHAPPAAEVMLPKPPSSSATVR